MSSNNQRKVRYAVAGLGNIAQVAVLPAFAHAKSSELVAFISSDQEKLRELAPKYHVSVTGSYDDLENVLAKAKVDALYVAVPNSLHRSVTEEQQQRGSTSYVKNPWR